MPVYMIIDAEVLDWDTYSQYLEKVSPHVEQYGGRYVVRGGRITPLSGDWTPERIVVIEFPSLDQLKSCFVSPEYAPLAAIRERSMKSRTIVVEGVE